MSRSKGSFSGILQFLEKTLPDSCPGLLCDQVHLFCELGRERMRRFLLVNMRTVTSCPCFLPLHTNLCPPMWPCSPNQSFPGPIFPEIKPQLSVVKSGRGHGSFGGKGQTPGCSGRRTGSPNAPYPNFPLILLISIPSPDFLTKLGAPGL